MSLHSGSYPAFRVLSQEGRSDHDKFMEALDREIEEELNKWQDDSTEHDYFLQALDREIEEELSKWHSSEAATQCLSNKSPSRRRVRFPVRPLTDLLEGLGSPAVSPRAQSDVGRGGGKMRFAFFRIFRIFFRIFWAGPLV